MHTLEEDIEAFRAVLTDYGLQHYQPLADRCRPKEMTLQEVARQSKFAVESVRMIYRVLVNYCRLNDRVYAKIVEHEYNSFAENVRLNALGSKFQRELEESMGSIKHMYETTFAQNRNNKELLDSGIEKLNQRLQLKADKVELIPTIMDKIVDYDQGEIDIEEALHDMELRGIPALKGKQRQIAIEQSVSSILLTQTNCFEPRKKGKVSYEDHYKLMDENERMISKLQTEIKQLYHFHRESKDSMDKQLTRGLQMEDMISELRSSIDKIRIQQKAFRTQITAQIEACNEYINSKVNQREWNRHFMNFEMVTIDPMRRKINEFTKTLKSDLLKHKEETYIKMSHLNLDLNHNVSELKTVREQINKDIENIAVLQMEFKDTEQRVNSEYEQLRTQMKSFMAESSKGIKQFQRGMKKDFAQTRHMITKLSATVEERASRALTRRIDNEFKSFSNDLMDNREMVKQLTMSSKIANQQILLLREQVSRKANFTDMVHYIENKADREEMKEMRIPGMSNPQSMTSLRKTDLRDHKKTQHLESLANSAEKAQHDELSETVKGNSKLYTKTVQTTTARQKEEDRPKERQKSETRIKTNKTLSSGIQGSSQRRLLIRGGGRRKDIRSETSLISNRGGDE